MNTAYIVGGAAIIMGLIAIAVDWLPYITGH